MKQTKWEKKIKNILDKQDWKAMAKLWQEEDIKWHTEEWKRFIELVRAEQRKDTEKMMKEVIGEESKDTNGFNNNQIIIGRNAKRQECIKIFKKWKGRKV